MSASTLYEHAATTSLEHLGLRVARDLLDQACQQAAADSWSYSHFLGWLLDGEIAERKRRGIELNLQFAKFPYRKRLADFDFAAQPSIDRRIIDELATGRFAGEGRNVILLGPPGVGKTHIAIALGVRAAELGMRVYFTSAMELARRLSKAMAENRLHREMRNLVRPSVLVIDEVGCLSMEAAQASLLFQVIAERYGKGQSIVLTSNKGFGEWGAVFASDAVMASAALDRLLHKATVINVRGESYRLRERRKAIGAEAMPAAERASENEQAVPRAGKRSRGGGREEGGEEQG
ncbi:MAG: IS21-like element helper ATPase IstB [Phycisphaerae bacterium]|nr:IS21-like element helper ATPase IstB [Phycisphaerae bacterium]